MAWTLPRTWAAGEVATAVMLNAHLRDNLLFLKTNIGDEGILKPAVKNFGFSSGQGNAAGGGDTQLTSYDVTIPANTLAKPGDALIIEGTWFHDGSSGTRTGKLSIGAGTGLPVIYSASTVSAFGPFRLVLRRRSQTGASVTGLAWTGLAGGAATQYLVNSSAFGTGFDWTQNQTLKVWAAHATANALRLSDYRVSFVLCLAGGSV